MAFYRPKIVFAKSLVPSFRKLLSSWAALLKDVTLFRYFLYFPLLRSLGFFYEVLETEVFWK